MCFFMTTITIIVRMDAYAVLYGLWLGLFLTSNRKNISRIWPVYFLVLLFILPIQYLWCLGLPPFLCYGNIFIIKIIALGIIYNMIYILRISMVLP